MTARLTVLSGPFSGKIIEIRNTKFLIGREEDCDLRPESRLVSRHHCVFLQDGFTLRVRDMGSRNGTYVNGTKVNGAMSLNNGDVISLGEMTLKVDHFAQDSNGSVERTTGHSNPALSQTDVFDGETLQGQIAAHTLSHPQSSNPNGHTSK